MGSWFARSSIGARMLVLAVSSALLTLAVGLFGLAQTAKVNDMLNAMFDNNLTPIADVANANMQAIYHNRAMLTYVAEDEAPRRVQLLDGMRKHEQRMHALLDKYRKTFLTPKEKELLDRFDKAWPPYMAAAARTLQMAQEGKSAEALNFLTDDAAPIFQRADDILSELVDFNVALGKQAYDESDVVVADSRTAAWAVIALAVVASVGGALAISRSITRPLGGEPAQVVAIADAVAQGDLTQTIALRSGDSSSAVARMAAMQASLARVVSTVREGAESVASASAQIAEGNNDLSGRTEEQASALEETAASMEQLSATVQRNAENARQANQLAQAASQVAGSGGDVVGRVVGTMKEINASSGRIADIISVIDGIAFQTNILALNAAVEAARAGEQGRGFAVVASEVRALAQRSAGAAKEIKLLISTSVEQVTAGSALVDQAGTTMQEVVQSIGRVHQIMGDISRASDEQSAGVSQIGEAVTQMDQTTQQNAALVEESAAAATRLRQQAAALLEAVAVFRVDGTARPVAAAQAAPAVAAPPLSRPAAAKPTLRAAVVPAPRAAAKAKPITLAARQPKEDEGWAAF